ncbi:hypothetical protein JOM56_009953 [Amanita muscaria]
MDNNYDWNGASDALAKFSARRMSKEKVGILLSEMTQESLQARNWTDEYKVMQTDANTWHLIHAPKDSAGCNAPEEVVVNLQGVMWKYDLPPFTAHTPNISKQVKYLRQSISLTGLGAPHFEASMKGLTNIFVLFSRFVPADKLQACSMMGKFGEHASMDSGNRYFTAKKDNPTERNIPFSTDVDPNRILERAAGSGYIHSEHNIVRYYERVETTDNKIRYNEIPPVRFREGDLVEAQMTILLVPLLHDATYSQNSFVARTTHALFPMIKPAMSLKRKIGYYDEEITATREKLS